MILLDKAYCSSVAFLALPQWQRKTITDRTLGRYVEDKGVELVMENRSVG